MSKKNKIIIVAVIVVVLIVVVAVALAMIGPSLLERPVPPEGDLPLVEYYGHSTYGQCQTNNECLVSGCSSEICQSRAEEPIASICIVPDRPTPPQLNYQCGCLAQRCQWLK